MIRLPAIGTTPPSGPTRGSILPVSALALLVRGRRPFQSIPIIAAQAKHLTVFQRTANYSIPAYNAPLDPEYESAVKADYAGFRQRAKQTPPGLALAYNKEKALESPEEARQREYEERWQNGGIAFLGAFSDIMLDPEANETAAEFVRDKIRATVWDPEVAALLSPRNVIGCKRLCVDTGYYETFNRPNVTLVDISEAPIDEITPTGLITNGRAYAFDAIVFAIGFDVMTGVLTRIDIRGRGGQTLSEKWLSGPRAYLGLATAGFPNLFTITGPGSPSVLTNMLPSIEQHVEWVADCLGYMREEQRGCIEPMLEAEDEWVAHVNSIADASLRSTCSSWYVGANVPGKPRVFMPYIGGFPAYVKKCQEVVANGYEGFALA